MLKCVVKLERSLIKLITSERGCFRPEALKHVPFHDCIGDSEVGRRVDFEFVEDVADDAGVNALDNRNLIQLMGDEVFTSVLDDEKFPGLTIKVVECGIVECLLRRRLVLVDLGSTRKLNHHLAGQLRRVMSDERGVADCFSSD